MPPSHTLDAVAIAAAVRTGSRSAIGVVEATLDRIDQLDPQFNSFTTILADRARSAAARIDARIAAKQYVGPLAGVPFAVKNLFDVAGVTTIAGSTILADAPPAKHDAFAIARLEAAGGILVGTLNMDEFAYGFSTENAHYGATRNPHDPGRIAGGSSGGSAAAVAAGLVPLTLGTDTNGSVRVPAALCGVFGLKPSFGRLSRTGVYPFVDSLDHVGLFARSVRDLAAAYDVLQSRDDEDPCQADRPLELTASVLDVPFKGLRVGVLGGWFARYAAPGILAAVDRVAAALGSVGTFELEYSDVARAAAFCITAAEAGTRFLQMLRARAAEFDPATRSRLMAGAMLPASVLTKAYNVRRDYVRNVDDLFETVDILLAPATPWTAPMLGQAMIAHGGETLPVRAGLGLYTQPISFAGMPVVVVPVHRDGEMPAGVQIIAPRWREDLALAIAAALERAAISSAPIAKRAGLEAVA
jgi:aspartyl-tRNA(Asn)/glutamyl-tRNA(Gln) amidotransferase subunit A